MRKSPVHSATNRSAFTLIEILVVIAIIAILASLLLAAVVAVRNRIPVATTRNDIMQLSTALNAFYAKYKFYPPDELVLCSTRTAYGNPAAGSVQAQSIAVLTKMFPDMTWTAVAWDGSNTKLNNVTLQGDQCLVFFLGGIPNGNGQPPQGFSTNPANPAALPTAAAPDRIKFMTTWDASRIQLLHTTSTSKNFPSYLDGFAVNLAAATGTGMKQKQPYMYFSSMCNAFRENGYDTTPTVVPGAPATVTISPYIQQLTTTTAPSKYWNSTTFQIISAGADGSFGPGGIVNGKQVQWPSTPPQNHSMDDMSNFNSTVLGAPD